jgi:rare lipoprotein A
MIGRIVFGITVSFIIIVAGIAAVSACEISYYSGGPREGGWRTASGERIGPATAASFDLPLGTRVRVKTRYGSAELRVNDRGPARWTGRCLDVSRDVAGALGLTAPGHLPAELEVLR